MALPSRRLLAWMGHALSCQLAERMETSLSRRCLAPSPALSLHWVLKALADGVTSESQCSWGGGFAAAGWRHIDGVATRL